MGSNTGVAMTVMRPIMAEYPGRVFVYMDDILIATEDNLPLHREIVHKTLEQLEREDLFLKLSKCHFEQRKVAYLGIEVEDGKVRMDPTKADGLLDWPEELHTVKDVRSCLGVFGYQRPFIQGYAKIV